MAQKQVTFYTTYGYLQDNEWHLPMRLQFHESPGRTRRALGHGARKALQKLAGLHHLDDHQKQRFKERASDFIADSESREVVRVRFDNDATGDQFTLRNSHGKSSADRNGLLEGTLSKPQASRLLEAQQSRRGWLTFRTALEEHTGSGRVQLVGPGGVSVVSDIDDTIKVTGIPEGERVVLNIPVSMIQKFFRR